MRTLFLLAVLTGAVLGQCRTLVPNTITGRLECGGMPACGGSVTTNCVPVANAGGVIDIGQTKASIVPNTVPSPGQVLVGNTAGTAYAAVTMEGDCSLSSVGALTCTALGIGTGAVLTGMMSYYICTAACTVTPPPPASRVQFCVLNGVAVKSVITLAGLGAGKFYGAVGMAAYGSSNGSMTSSGAVNDRICMIAIDANHYIPISSNGNWKAN